MRPIFIIARERGGSDVLGEILAMNGLAVFESAFDVDNPAAHSLGRFLRTCNVGAAEFVSTPDVILDEYLSWCADLAGSDRFCLETAPRFLHLFNGRAWLIGQRPRLVERLRAEGHAVVLFRRRQPLRQALEALLDAAGSTPVAVDPARCQALMKEAGDNDARLGRWFRGHAACRELVIEDLLADGAVSDEGALRLEEAFGVRIVARAPGRRLRHDDFRALIANRGDLIAAFAGGPQEAEAREILG